MRSVRGRRRTGQGGYAYLALLILIAIMGVTAAASAQLGAIYQRRMAEKELLFVGGEFQRALLSYASATPLGQPTQPRTLDDLLRDPRYPNAVRHLRKLYEDPMTGKADWVFVKSPDGQTIVGIHSASTARPIQIAHFPAEFQGFEDKHSYMEWVFVARIPTLMPGGGMLNSSPSNGNLSNSNSSNSGSSNGGSLNNGPSNSSPFNNGPSNNSPFNSGPSNSSPFNSAPSNSSPFNSGPSSNSPFNSNQ